jgi:hypothetical protein
MEARIRSLQETFKWKPANGSSNSSQLSNQFIILDAGLGFKF